MFDLMVQFPETRGRDRTAAFDELLRLYHAPLLAMVQRLVGDRAEDAHDLTQAMMLTLFERNDLAKLDPSSGQFRSWLCAAVRNFVHKDGRHRRTQKCGGGAQPLALDVAANDERPPRALADTRTPYRAYARRQANEILQHAMDTVRRAEQADGKLHHFDQLRPLMDGREPPAALAARLGIPAGTLNQQVARLRERHRHALRTYFRARGVKPADVELEIKRLFDALR